MAADIGSLLRALDEVIIPALPESESLALEQAHLMLLYLRRMDSQHEHLLHYRQRELSEFFYLLSTLYEISKEAGLDLGNLDQPVVQMLGKISPWVSLNIPSYASIENSVVEVREITDQLVRLITTSSSSASSLKLKAQHAVLAQAMAEVIRERAWNKEAGFDFDVAGLPAMDVLLNSESDGAV